MSSIKNHIPRPIKRLYRGIRSSVLSPESDRLFNILYEDTLTVTEEDISIEFDTSSTIAKRWFYPRYRDGSLHEPVVSRTLLDLIDGDSVFFDVGANVGFYTVLGAEICSEVHAFEMDLRLASIVSAHFDRQKHKGVDVRIIPASIGDTTGEFVTFIPHQTENLSTNSIDAGQSGRHRGSNFQMQTLALDDYIERCGVQPDVLKIDVEGFEMSVLKGLSRTIGAVRALLLEVHPNLLNRYGTNAEEVLELLNEYGFTIRRFTDHRATTSPEDSLKPINKETPLRENGMILCTR